ncbi:MAG: hypothetical protein M3Z24_02610 [Chloroflexota bacterium]|nr:hypothetical protein [Chloroflexota bacterium]
MIISRIMHLMRWRYKWLVLLCYLLLICLCCAACSDVGGGNSNSSNNNSQAPESDVALAKIHWCGKPLVIFRDEHASSTATPGTGTPTTIPSVTASPTGGASPTVTVNATITSGPTTITDWTQVEPKLGFMVYLPVNLPAKTCLISASGTIHDPIFGGSFTIGYLLSEHSSLSFSEAPLGAKTLAFQCNPSGGNSPQAGTSSGTPMPNATQTPLLICNGAKGSTNIFFSARGSTDSLKKIFENLSPNVNWVPAS